MAEIICGCDCHERWNNEPCDHGAGLMCVCYSCGHDCESGYITYTEGPVPELTCGVCGYPAESEGELAIHFLTAHPRNDGPRFA